MPTFEQLVIALMINEFCARSYFKPLSIFSKSINAIVFYSSIGVMWIYIFLDVDEIYPFVVLIARFLGWAVAGAWIDIIGLITKRFPGPAFFILTKGRYVKASKRNLEFILIEHPLLSLKQPKIKSEQSNIFNDIVGYQRVLTYKELDEKADVTETLEAHTNLPVIGCEERVLDVTIETNRYAGIINNFSITRESVLRYLTLEVDRISKTYGEYENERENLTFREWRGVDMGEVLSYKIEESRGVEYKLVFFSDEKTLFVVTFFAPKDPEKHLVGFTIEDYIKELVEMMSISTAQIELKKLSFNDLVRQDEGIYAVDFVK